MKLVLRSPLFLQESLTSYLARLAIINGYPSPETVLGLIPEQINKYSSKWFAALSELTDVEDCVLYEASNHSLADVIIPPGKHLSDIQLNCGARSVLPLEGGSKNLRSKENLSFCPLCIRTNPYHRLHWTPKLSLICPTHRCFLVSYCSECHAPIGMNSVLSKCCYHCGNSLIKEPQRYLDQDSLEIASQAVIQSWFGYQVGSGNLNLLTATPRTLYAVVSDLYEAIRRLYDRNPIPEACKSTGDDSIPEQSLQPTPATKFDYVTSSFKALTNWPLGFHDFLETYRSRAAHPKGRMINLDFPYLKSTLLEHKWNHPEFDPLQRAFEDFLVQHYQRVQSVEQLRRYQENESFQSRFEDVSVNQAARMIEITPVEVSELMKQGQLWRRIDSNSLPTNPPWIPRNNVQMIMETWRQEFTVTSAAKALGTTEAVVRRLIERGHIEIQPELDSTNGDDFKITGKAYYRFLQTFRRALGISSGTGIYTLQEALERLSPFGFDTVAIIEAVLRRELQVQNSSGFNKLQLCKSDVDNLRGKLSGSLVQEFLAPHAKKRGVHPTILLTWVRTGLIHLERVGNDPFFISDQEWQRFDKTYISASQAAEYLGITLPTFGTWVNRGRIREVGWRDYHVHSNLYLREDVEKFAPGKCLRKDEIRKEYGISSDQLNEWLAQKKIIPISGPGVDRWRHHLFSRIDIEKTLASQIPDPPNVDADKWLNQN